VNRRLPVRLVLSLLMLTLTSGCAELLDLLRASSAGSEPTFTFLRADVRDANLESLTLDTVWRLDNPNDLAISLAQVDYALFIEGKQVVAGSPATGLQIAARGSTELHFPANVKFVDLAGVAQTFLTRDTAAWRVQGALGVSTPIGVVSLPLSTSGQFEVPKVPAVQFGSPRVSNVSFAGATIEFPLQITNKNSYSLPISNITGALSIGGAPVGTLSTGDLGAMTGRGTRTVNLPLTVNFLSAAGALVNVAQGGNAQVRFDAQVQSGRLALPVKVDQLLNFVR
jgi:LEA14-like dessication related protein